MFRVFVLSTIRSKASTVCIAPMLCNVCVKIASRFYDKPEKIFMFLVGVNMFRQTMKLRGLVLLVVLMLSVGLPYMYAYQRIWDAASKDEFFFGVTFGSETAEEARVLIDKVKDYTNLFVVDSWTLCTNETALNEVCEYAVKADLNIIVFFDFVSRIIYPWHQTWLDTAKEKWGDNFLGVYLFDEPGGNQIDKGMWTGEMANEMTQLFENVSNCSDAANAFVNSISSINSTVDVKRRGIPTFTSDYALYWFDYLSGYDTVFVELGWNHSETQHIALGRGAANAQGKDWGAIIVWTYEDPPYLASGPQIFQDMLTAYRSGAKYVVVFNYPKHPDTNPYGILTREHFTAMEQFWTYIHAYPRNILGKVDAQVAFVLPKDYGWGMRNVDDKIWGLWPADEKAPLIWENMNKLITRYGLGLDIIYDDVRFNYREKYSQVYLWNATIN
jgi:hypothetical protein